MSMDVQQYFFLVQFMNIYGSPHNTQAIRQGCIYTDFDQYMVDLTDEEISFLGKLTIFLECAMAMSLLLTLCLIRRGRSKKKSITVPAGNLLLDWNQTYCVLSLQMVQLVQVALWSNIPRLVYFMVIVALPDSTVQWWYLSKEGFPSCVHSNIGYILHYLIWDSMFLLGESVMLVQGFEWIAMFFLISSQKNKSVVQIIENQETQVLKKKCPARTQTEGESWYQDSLIPFVQEAYQKKEQRLLRAMQAFAVAFILLYIVVLNGLYFMSEEVRDTMVSYIQMFTIVFQSGCLLLLGWPMFRHHRFEFKEQRCTLLSQWTLALLIQISYSSYLKTSAPYYEMGLFLLQLPLFFIALLFLYVKSSSDVLQGVSKLDYLLKVSIFQNYKQEEKRTLLPSESSISSASSAHGSNSSASSSCEDTDRSLSVQN